MRNFCVVGSLLVLALFLCALPVQAAWAPSGLAGENVQALAEDPGNAATWYAGTYIVGTDGSASGDIHKYEASTGWVLSSTGLPADSGVLSITVDPANSATVYAGLDGAGAYKTVDGGLNWTASGLDGLSVRDIAVAPYDTSVAFAATDNGIYRSVDAGANWTVVVSAAVDSSDIRKITLSPAQTDVVYAAAMGGLYKSADGGMTWSKLAVQGSQSFNTLAVDPDNPSTVYAGTSDAGVFRSIDGGSTWAQIYNGGSQSITSFAFNPFAADCLLAGTADGRIIRTDDGGDRWYFQDDGSTAAAVNGLGYTVPQASYIMAATDNGVMSYNNSKPDLIVTNVSGPASMPSGENGTAYVTFRNVGAVAANGGGRVQLYMKGPSYRYGLYPVGMSFTSHLPSPAPGQKLTVAVNFKTPYFFSGVHSYVAKVDDYNYVSESNETNNLLTGNQVDIIPPDLIVTNVSGPTSLPAGGSGTVSITVKNVGVGTAKGSGYVRLYIEGPSWNYGLYDLGYSLGYSSPMAPGKVVTVSKSFTLPGFFNGDHHFVAKVDANNHLAESDETNNYLTGNMVTIGNRPPVADPGVNRPEECTSPDGTPVTLDASGSSDPDGDTLTFEWTKDGVVISNDMSFTTAPLPLGVHTYTLTVDDGRGLSDAKDVTITVEDTTPPTTTSKVSGELRESGWYVSDVDVELTATDTCSGVRDVHYTITGPGHDGSETIVPGDNADFNLDADGSYTVTYWSVDNEGNVEGISMPEEVSLEVQPPAVTPIVPPIPASGYYTSCVTVRLETTDSASGTAVTEYLDPATGQWMPYDDTVGIPVCGSTTIEYRATSPAGNVFNNTITINIDQTPPVITILNVVEDEVYQLGLFTSPSYTVTDATSGVASSSDSLTGGDGLGLGKFTYSVTATDVAGNTATVTIQYEVEGSIAGTTELVNQYVASGDIDSSLKANLLDALNRAKAASDAEDYDQADTHLDTFIHLVDQGKDLGNITADAAAVMKNAARYVIQNN